jgi:hypothetical protein
MREALPPFFRASSWYGISLSIGIIIILPLYIMKKILTKQSLPSKLPVPNNFEYTDQVNSKNCSPCLGYAAKTYFNKQQIFQKKLSRIILSVNFSV